MSTGIYRRRSDVYYYRKHVMYISWTAPAVTGRIMSSIAGAGGLAGSGGIAGAGGGLAA